MTQDDHDFVVSDVEYNVITTLATLLQSEDVLAQYTEDAQIAGKQDIADLFMTLRKHHKDVARGLRAALREDLASS
jgi:predicted component of type VI protein secretion system